MSRIKHLLAGLGGAVALNLLHESLKKQHPDMPRIDLLGEEALQKGLQCCGYTIENPATLYKAALAGDIISNAAYYSMIGSSKNANLWGKAVTLGLAAGVGAVTLPEKLGLNPEPVARNTKVKALTVGYYLAGALVTAGLLQVLHSDKP